MSKRSVATFIGLICLFGLIASYIFWIRHGYYKDIPILESRFLSEEMEEKKLAVLISNNFYGGTYTQEFSDNMLSITFSYIVDSETEDLFDLQKGTFIRDNCITDFYEQQDYWEITDAKICQRLHPDTGEFEYLIAYETDKLLKIQSGDTVLTRDYMEKVIMTIETVTYEQLVESFPAVEVISI